MEIREANSADFKQIWPIFQEIVQQGDTYTYTPDTNKEEAYDLWMIKPKMTFVAEEDGNIVGTYYINTNQDGPGSHVCNCGYMIPKVQRGKGIATAMCEHSQKIASELGYLAMQFNFVAASNQGAVNLWVKLGYEIVGKLPKAFNHPEQGLVDALVMYKWLS